MWFLSLIPDKTYFHLLQDSVPCFSFLIVAFLFPVSMKRTHGLSVNCAKYVVYSVDSVHWICCGRSAHHYNILFIGNGLATGFRFLPCAQKSISYYLSLYEKQDKEGIVFLNTFIKTQQSLHFIVYILYWYNKSTVQNLI